MKNAIGVVVTAGLVIGVCTPAKAQNLEGTLKKVKETGTWLGPWMRKIVRFSCVYGPERR